MMWAVELNVQGACLERRSDHPTSSYRLRKQCCLLDTDPHGPGEAALKRQTYLETVHAW